MLHLNNKMTHRTMYSCKYPKSSFSGPKDTYIEDVTVAMDNEVIFMEECYGEMYDDAMTTISRFFCTVYDNDKMKLYELNETIHRKNFVKYKVKNHKFVNMSTKIKTIDGIDYVQRYCARAETIPKIVKNNHIIPLVIRHIIISPYNKNYISDYGYCYYVSYGCESSHIRNFELDESNSKVNKYIKHSTLMEKYSDEFSFEEFIEQLNKEQEDYDNYFDKKHKERIIDDILDYKYELDDKEYLEKCLGSENEIIVDVDSSDFE